MIKQAPAREFQKRFLDAAHAGALATDKDHLIVINSFSKTYNMTGWRSGAVLGNPEVIAAYDAPFPDDAYKAGARQFPMLVPSTPDDPAAPANRAAWEVFRRWEKPFLTAFSDRDPITGGSDKVFQREVPGCTDQPHTVIEGGGHFLQEWGEPIARAAVGSL